MVDLPLLAPFLPEIAAAFAGIALILLASMVADRLGGETGGGFLSYLTAPLDVVKSLVHNALVAVSNAVLSSQGIRVAHLLDGVADSVQSLIFYPARLFAGVHAALAFLWNHAIPGYVKAIVNPVIGDVHDLTGKIAADVAGLHSDIATTLHAAETYVDGEIAKAEGYADHVVAAAAAALRSEFNTALGKLQATEDTAVAHAVDLATTAERDIGSAFAKAEAYADTITKPIGADLSDLEAYIKSLGLPTLIAAIPALGLLVQTIASESGLDNAACRSKVKGICGTDPTRWLGLLEGLAAIALAFDLRELVKVAESIADPAVALIRQAA